MKPIEECHVQIIDAGTFIPLAERIGRTARQTSYYSPFEEEYLDIGRCVVGDGMKTFQRVDEYMDPEHFNSVDLWLFPDIGYGGLQRYLRSLGKNVWGSMGASDLELYRTRFVDVIQRLGLPMVPSVKIRGLTALAEHLKGVENKWVKLNRFRENMETWKHYTFETSARMLEHLACVFGPLKEHVSFVVQDEIKDEEDSPVMEVGYDGWFVTSPDGEGLFPPATFQGFEQKNELYLGAKLDYEELPEGVREVNESFGKELAKYGYRNFWATEIRIKDGTPYFIDPTSRMAGQTMEHLLETCSNLPQVIHAGAQGIIIPPVFEKGFAAEATMHYKGDGDGWMTLKVPGEIAQWVKLYRCCCVDGAYQFPPHKSGELGVICGIGDSIEGSIDALKENFEPLSGEPVSIETGLFADLLKQIQDYESEGEMFSHDTPPEPEVVLKG